MSHFKSITSFITRRRRTVDAELEQGLLRIGILSAVVVYLAVSLLLSPTALHEHALLSAVIFLFIAFGLLIWIKAGPTNSTTRKIVGQICDIGESTFGLYFFGTTTSPLYVVYLWVIFGNGFRYGTPYLVLAAAQSTVGFSLVLTFTPYWHEHLPLGIGLLLGLTRPGPAGAAPASPLDREARAQAFQRRHHLPRGPRIVLHARAHVDGVGAELAGAKGGHGRVHAVAASLVRTGGDHAASAPP